MPEWIIEALRTGDLPLALYIIYLNWELMRQMNNANTRIEKLTRHFLRIHKIEFPQDE